VYAVRYRTRRAVICASFAAVVWLLLSAPALWLWFTAPDVTFHTVGMATFARGVSHKTLAVFFANYFAHFKWVYLVVNGDPRAGITWRYLNGFGAFYWWIVVLAALGLFTTFRYVRDRLLAWWLLLWVIVYPLGGSLVTDGAGIPNAARTLAGAPVFCIFAAFGMTLLFDELSRLRSIRLAQAAKFLLGVTLALLAGFSLDKFAQFYFRDYSHLTAEAWDSGTRRTFETIVANSAGYSRVCIHIRPAFYSTDAYARFYLYPGSQLLAIEDDYDPRCSWPGTMLVEDNVKSRVGFHEIARVYDLDGYGFAVISVNSPD
jgi:hypothetical protein